MSGFLLCVRSVESASMVKERDNSAKELANLAADHASLKLKLEVQDTLPFTQPPLKLKQEGNGCQKKPYSN